LEGVITVVERNIHASIYETYNIGPTIPSSICNETNVFIDPPSSSIVAEFADDFDTLDVNGITQGNNTIDTESNDVCDADTGGGY
jgi:hypothetical protein